MGTVAWLAFALFAAGCGGRAPEPSPSPSSLKDKPLGAVAEDIERDTITMREANDAANEVIRQAGDCDAARPLIPAAVARLDDVDRRLRTATGHQTLDALRKKVREVSEACS